jgi:hypothetical protein
MSIRTYECIVADIKATLVGEHLSDNSYLIQKTEKLAKIMKALPKNGL